MFQSEFALLSIVYTQSDSFKDTMLTKIDSY